MSLAEFNFGVVFGRKPILWRPSMQTATKIKVSKI